MNKIFNDNYQKISKVNLKLLFDKIGSKLVFRSAIAFVLLKGTILILIFATLLLFDRKNFGIS